MNTPAYSEPTEIPPPAYRVGHVAHILGLSDQWVRERISAGELRAFKAGKYYRIFQEDLNTFIAQHMQPPRISAEEYIERTPTDQIIEDAR